MTVTRRALEKATPFKRCVHCGKEYGPNPLHPGNFKRSRVCGLACNHARKRYGPERAKAAFWSRVKMDGENGCWLYMGARDKWGYGDVQFERKHVQAHRLSWRLLRGEPGPMDVLHTCNNPPCCNPEHLYLGTDADNALDRIKAGTILRGEALHTAKLDNEAVKAIRAEYSYKGPGRGRKSNASALAERYGVAPGTIIAVVSRRTWSHIK